MIGRSGTAKEIVERRLNLAFWRPDTWRWLLAAIVFLCLVGILSVNLTFQRVDLKVGQISPDDIYAPRNIENRHQTQALRDEAVREALKEAAADPANFDVNPAVTAGAEDRLHILFSHIELARNEQRPRINSLGDGAGTPVEADDSPVAARTEAAAARIAAELGIGLTKERLIAATLATPEVYNRMKEGTRSLVRRFVGVERIDENRLDAVRVAARGQAAELPLPPALRDLAGEIVRALIEPNLVLNPAKLERVRQQTDESVDPVTIQKGQKILGKGDPVAAEHIQILRDLGMLDPQPNLAAVGGIALMVLLLMLLVGVYLQQYNPEVLGRPALLGLLGLLAVTVTGLSKILSAIPWPWTGYLTPVAFGSIMVALLVESRLAVVFTLALGILVGMVFGPESTYVIVALAGGIAGVFGISKVSQRSDLTRAGILVSMAGFTSMLALGLVSGDTGLLLHSWAGAGNGMISAIAAIGSLPYVEALFGITSSIRLLELLNPSHPLLRKLLMDAPGTYHHSIMVGNLAEAAAEAVGADGLLSRVGAQYHDIGKSRRPYFFVENQFGSENPHDKITPNLSTLIIVSHVKDGVAMAREHKLPEALVDFIRTHHGADLVKYFYHRALNQQGNGEVNETDFRYPGPKPQTMETGIVMLADAVEATVRSMPKHTPGRIEAVVRRLIRDRLEDGQLDECDLTLKDLDRIAHAFVRVLTGMYHQRIEYPEGLLREAARRRG